jgi:hypothetical protein
MIVVSELREVYIEVILTIPKYSIKIHLQKLRRGKLNPKISGVHPACK